ncbi:MAG: hypothetical protein ABIH72_00660 [archaeon]
MEKRGIIVVLLVIFLAGLAIAAEGNATTEFETQFGSCSADGLHWIDELGVSHATTFDPSTYDLIEDSTYCTLEPGGCCPSGFTCVPCSPPAGPGCGCQGYTSEYCSNGSTSGGQIVYCADYPDQANCTIDSCGAVTWECLLDENNCEGYIWNGTMWWASVNESCKWNSTGNACYFHMRWVPTICFNGCDDSGYYYCDRTTTKGNCQGGKMLVSWGEILYHSISGEVFDANLETLYGCQDGSRYYNCGFSEQLGFFNIWGIILALMLISLYYVVREKR